MCSENDTASESSARDQHQDRAGDRGAARSGSGLRSAKIASRRAGGCDSRSDPRRPVEAPGELRRRTPESLLFTGELSGGPVRRSNFSQRVNWPELVTRLGMSGAHFHDLRHAGNIWASKAGMSTRDLMARMGHDDMRATLIYALIYQRATSEADRRIAEQLSAMVEAHRKGTKKGTKKP
jgi:hypothetical protein